MISLHIINNNNIIIIIVVQCPDLGDSPKMVKWSSLLLHVQLIQQLNTPVMVAISWTTEMPNVSAKLRVLGVVKLLNAVCIILL